MHTEHRSCRHDPRRPWPAFVTLRLRDRDEENRERTNQAHGGCESPRRRTGCHAEPCPPVLVHGAPPTPRGRKRLEVPRHRRAPPAPKAWSQKISTPKDQRREDQDHRRVGERVRAGVRHVTPNTAILIEMGDQSVATRYEQVEVWDDFGEPLEERSQASR